MIKHSFCALVISFFYTLVGFVPAYAQEPVTAESEVSAAEAEVASDNQWSRDERISFIRGILPEGRIDVDVMEIRMSRADQEFAQKVKTFMQANPDWVAEKLADRKPGEPLPYDERMGVTEEEFDRFIESGGGKAEKSKTASIRIRTKDGVTTFYSTEVPLVHKVTLNLEDDEASAVWRLGNLKLNEVSEVHAGGNSALGKWDGVSWKSQPVDVAGALVPGITGRSDTLSIGKKSGEDRGVIYYQTQSLSRSARMAKSRAILEFDLPKPRE